MAERKKDAKKRLLRDGERQRKDGRYEYRYTDLQGEQRSIYSWRLVESDPLPKGKRPCAPLRDLEKEILEQQTLGLDVHKASTMTLDEAFDWYIECNPKWKPTTRATRKSTYNSYIRGGFGKQRVVDIRNSQIKRLYITLQRERNICIGTIEVLHETLHPIFEGLVTDDILRKNPADKAMKDVEVNPSTKRHALTVEQQTILLDFIEATPKQQHWRPLIVFLLGTGARIGEAGALRWRHVDFEKGVVNIEENLITYRDDSNNYVKEITTPKTEAGTRSIPMFGDVKQVLLDLRDSARFRCQGRKLDDEFVFVTRSGSMLVPSYGSVITRYIREAYNKGETARAEKEDRDPVLLPQFTPHSLRHTFCTRLCEQGMNIKVVQYVMGHEDIATTMNIYNEATGNFVNEEFVKYDGAIRVS